MFDLISVIDVHGNSKRNEEFLVTKDENVFDIQQGVAILIARQNLAFSSAQEILHFDLWGSRKSKYQMLTERMFSFEHSSIEPIEPYYLFKPQDIALLPEYQLGWKIHEIFSAIGDPAPGVVTTHDEFAVAFTQPEIIKNVQLLISTNTEAEARQYFRLCSQNQWSYEKAKDSLSTLDLQSKILPIVYRPFDKRFTINDSNVAVHRRERVLKHMWGMKNLAFCTNRQVNSGFRHVFCTRLMVNDCALSTASKERTYILPLYFHSGLDDSLPSLFSTTAPNIGSTFLKALASQLALKQVGEYGLPENLVPENIFDYIYSILHCPTYRTRYAEFLKIDFPRIPITSSLDLFRSLATLGSELVALHLVEAPLLTGIEVQHAASGWHYTHLQGPLLQLEFTGPQQPLVEKPSWSNDTVWLDKAQSVGFHGVPEAVWNFHIGGYQVCDKWLKDRKGRTLSADDITHYHRIVVALHETIRIMGEIDAVIEAHGGWPIQ